nr:HNH endonuclease [Actinomycetota bacterium]
RSLHLSRTFAGRSECKASFDPEGGELVATALRVATTADVDGEPARSPSTRRADALFDVCRFFLDHQSTRLGRRHRPHLNVVIDTGDGADLDTEAVARLFDGPRLDRSTLRRLLCDAGLHRVLTSGRSAILDYGRTTYTIAPAVWAALGLRDEHCRFPGCDRPLHWCEAHHVRPWSRGGPTRLSNLALVCTRHHHLLHRPGWSMTLEPDADVVVTTAEGKVLRSSLANAPPALLRV